MEQILKAKIEGIALDTKSLAQLAEKLSRRRAQDGLDPLEPDEADCLEIDEGCTIDPVGNTTTRTCPQSKLEGHHTEYTDRLLG